MRWLVVLLGVLSVFGCKHRSSSGTLSSEALPADKPFWKLEFALDLKGAGDMCKPVMEQNATYVILDESTMTDQDAIKKAEVRMNTKIKGAYCLSTDVKECDRDYFDNRYSPANIVGVNVVKYTSKEDKGTSIAQLGRTNHIPGAPNEPYKWHCACEGWSQDCEYNK